MGESQLLPFVLGVILVGIALLAGIRAYDQNYPDENDARELVLTYAENGHLLQKANSDPEIRALIAAAVNTSAARTSSSIFGYRM